jgi:hypothetical protein
MNDINNLYSQLIELELFTSKELELITNMNGYSIETLNGALYSRYGYRDLEQMQEEE